MDFIKYVDIHRHFIHEKFDSLDIHTMHQMNRTVSRCVYQEITGRAIFEDAFQDWNDEQSLSLRGSVRYFIFPLFYKPL